MTSKATQLLYEEHEVILKAIDQLHSILSVSTSDINKEELLWFIGFFKEYGDAFHHQKEECLFFKLLKEKNELIGNGIVAELTDQHTDFRESLRLAEKYLHHNDWDNLKKTLHKYLLDLTDHISAENDELFVCADMILNDIEKDNLYFSFIDKDKELGYHVKLNFEETITKG